MDDTPARQDNDLTLAELYIAALAGIQDMIDVTIAYLKYAQGAEFDLDSVKWHEQEVDGTQTCQLMLAGELLLSWQMNPATMQSECRWRRCQTVH